MGRKPKLRLHKPSGQAVVTLNGRDFYLGPYFGPSGRRSRKARLKYDRLLTEYRGGNCSPAFGLRNDLTVAELILAFYKHLKATFGSDRRSEAMNYRTVLRATRKLYRELPAAEFGPRHYKAVRQSLVDSGKASRPYINTQMRRLVRMFRWAAGEELVGPSIYRKLEAVEPLKAGRTEAREPEPVEPVSDATVEATLPHCNHVIAAMIRFQRLTGCRPGEVCSIAPGMVDRSGDVWLIRLRQHKNAHRGKGRMIPCGPRAQEILAPFLLRDADAPCFSPTEAVKRLREERAAARKTPLSCGNRAGTNRAAKPKRTPGQAYTSNSYMYAVRRACVKAKVDTWSPNQLRHAAATEFRREHGLEASQVLLGHSRADTTQIYAERDERRAIEVARQIG